MEVGAIPRKMMEGRPRFRWMDDDVADLKVMKVIQWIEKMKDREQWRLVVEDAKVHPGLLRREEGRNQKVSGTFQVLQSAKRMQVKIWNN
jgi:hypothetical protein